MPWWERGRAGAELDPSVFPKADFWCTSLFAPQSPTPALEFADVEGFGNWRVWGLQDDGVPRQVLPQPQAVLGHSLPCLCPLEPELELFNYNSWDNYTQFCLPPRLPVTLSKYKWLHAVGIFILNVLYSH